MKESRWTEDPPTEAKEFHQLEHGYGNWCHVGNYSNNGVSLFTQPYNSLGWHSMKRWAHADPDTAEPL